MVSTTQKPATQREAPTTNATPMAPSLLVGRAELNTVTLASLGPHMEVAAVTRTFIVRGSNAPSFVAASQSFCRRRSEEHINRGY